MRYFFTRPGVRDWSDQIFYYININILLLLVVVVSSSSFALRSNIILNCRR